MHRVLSALVARGSRSHLASDTGLTSLLKCAALDQGVQNGAVRGFSSEGEAPPPPPGKISDDSRERRDSGAQASTSSAKSEKQQAAQGRAVASKAHLRPAAASSKGAPGKGGGSQPSTLGRPATTLEAKKAYHRVLAQRSRKQQQHADAEQGSKQAGVPVAKQASAKGKEAKAKGQPAPKDPWNGLRAHRSTTDELWDEHFAKYVDVDLDVLPEIFSQNHPAGQDLHPTGGCKGLLEEMLATGKGLIMYRKCIHLLREAALFGEPRKFFLIGPPSSGKSIALAAVVSALRAEGWMVMYVPQALQLTHGGFFSRRGEGGPWDTPECARLMLHYLLEAHPEQAADVTCQPSGRSLAEVAREGIAAEEPAAVVDAFLEVKAAFATTPRAAICIDNYQALYLPTEYGEWMNQHHRRIVQPEELRVAAAMRVLEQPQPKQGVYICAASEGGSFSPKMRLPIPQSSLHSIPRMNPDEWAAMAKHYKLTGTTDNLPEERLAKAFMLTQGNAREYRRIAGLLDLGLDKRAAMA